MYSTVSLYVKGGIFVAFLAMLGGVYYSFCYSPKHKLEKKVEKSAKELRAEYVKNSALEVELVQCINDKQLLSFEGEMKGAGDEINDYNISTNGTSLTF